MTLAALLRDWTDTDAAEHALAKILGVMPPRSHMRDAKWVYWSNSSLGNELHALLDRLTNLGFLERRDEPDLQYRLNENFARTLDIDKSGTRNRPGPLPR